MSSSVARAGRNRREVSVTKMSKDTFLRVPTFDYTRSQRFDATASCGNVVSQQSSADSSDEEEPFSDPSPVVDHLLASPMEQSSSSTDEEATIEQSRKATRTSSLVGGAQFISTVKPFLTEVIEDEILQNCQKTWGPSNNPFSRPELRRSLSCPSSPTSNSPDVTTLFLGIRQDCRDPSHADDVHIAEGFQFTKQPEVYGLKKHIASQLGESQPRSRRNCADNRPSQVVGEDKHPQEHEITDTQAAGKLERKLEKCFFKQSVPIECTHTHDVPITDSKRKSSVQHFTGFGDLESYSGSSYMNIYSKLEKVQGINFKAMQCLGNGGNSIIYSYGEFAIKETKFDKKALNIICQLSHPNIMELLGVTLLDRFSDVCFHIMPLMTYDLHRGLRSAGGILRQLTQESDESSWVIVKSNVLYILKEVLRGLSYLHEQYIQHGDIKGKNILIKKTCHCQDIVLCTCPDGKKYSVKLADFDYIRQLDCHHEPVDLLSCAYKWFEYLGGTLTYRGPEESLKDRQGHSLNGTSSDMYSLGVLLLKVCLGEGSRREKQQANILARQPEVPELTNQSEAYFVLQQRIKLQRAARQCGKLEFLVDIVENCLEVNPSYRPTAHELLSIACELQSMHITTEAANS